MSFVALSNISVQLYIMKFESLPVFNQNQKAMIDEYKANLYAVRGDFYGSSNFLTAALSGKRKAKTALMTEMNNLLYAYTEAENSKIELQQSEKIQSLIFALQKLVMMKSNDSIDKIGELKAFIKTTNLPEFPVEIPMFGVIVNPKKFLQEKLEKLEKDPNNPHYRCVIKTLESIMKHLMTFH